MDDVGSGIDLISRALGVGAEVGRDKFHLHRTGKRPPVRIDGRRRRPRQPGKPFVPEYQQIAGEVDRRRTLFVASDMTYPVQATDLAIYRVNWRYHPAPRQPPRRERTASTEKSRGDRT